MSDKMKIQPKLVEKTTREDPKPAADAPAAEQTSRESRRRMRRRMRRVL